MPDAPFVFHPSLLDVENPPLIAAHASAADAIAARFPTAATGAPPTPAQRDAVATLQQGTRGLAELIVELVPDGPNREIALTSLEDVLMRSNRGVFVDAQ